MYTFAVITVSDRCFAGERTDTSGPCITEMMQSVGYRLVGTALVPDEKKLIEAEIIKCADELRADVVLTTGGTGFSVRDVTPEATLGVIDREARGIPAAMMHESLKVTPRAMLSRAVAGLRGSALVINLPGSEKAARENLQAVIGTLDHALKMISGYGHEEEKTKC